MSELEVNIQIHKDGDGFDESQGRRCVLSLLMEYEDLGYKNTIVAFEVHEASNQETDQEMIDRAVKSFHEWLDAAKTIKPTITEPE